MQDIEKKWQARWAQAGLFEPQPDSGRKKKLITAAFPYPNSPQHIGHGRAYSTTDIYARYLRMHGYNVLFPMGFHVTGTPILAMAKRIASGDRELFEIFERIYGIPPEVTRTLAEPTALVMHFSREIEAGMREMGYSIDWRRKFYSSDPAFNRFIQWQFRKLKQLGYLVQGEHPIAWCPQDNQAVGAHDTKGDVDPELKDFIWIKFRVKGSDLILMTGTTRPDALLGQSNLWIDPHGTYKIVQVKNEKWVVGEASLEKVHDQCDPHAKVIGEIHPKELIGRWVQGPIVGYELYTLPAEFIDASTGSGLVYSALEDPVDLYELRKIQTDPSIVTQYGLDSNVVAKLKPIPIIDVEGMGSDLGDSIGKEFGITSANQKDKLEEAKGELNRRVYRKGIMNTRCGKYSGMRVPHCQEEIKKDLLKSGDAVMFWELNNKPIYCRCGAHLIVKLLNGQWFIDYGKEEWKAQAKQCLAQMTIVPEKTRGEYLYAIDWFKQKACARSQGLGTRFPFDEKLVIEALSDSTIYMAFYTFVHLLGGFAPEALDEAFFDYVLLGKGKPENKKLDAVRDSFLYWYPVDSRHSGADLIRNHLPFFIFIHVALFEKAQWPRQIVTNGFVLMDGKKMSKSLANILPLRKAIREYGADVVRFAIVSGADLSQDSDFSRSVAEGTRSRLQFIYELVETTGRGSGVEGRAHSNSSLQPPASSTKSPPSSHIENWLRSRLHRCLKEAPALYETLALRELALQLFYEVYSDLKWALKRDPDVPLRAFFESWVPAIAPLLPHYAEEFGELLGQKGFVSTAPFPAADPEWIREDVERGEALVQNALRDCEKIVELVGKKASAIYVYTASRWKFDLYAIAQTEKRMDGILKKAAQQPALKPHMADAARVVKAWSKHLHALPPVLGEKEERDMLQQAQEFLSRELGCNVRVLSEKDGAGKHEKAKNALPGKPAIVVE